MNKLVQIRATASDMRGLKELQRVLKLKGVKYAQIRACGIGVALYVPKKYEPFARFLADNSPSLEFEGPLGIFWDVNEVPNKTIIESIKILVNEARRRKLNYLTTVLEEPK